MFDIEKCWMCHREDISLTGNCSISYFYGRIKYIDDIKYYITKMIENRDITKDKIIYLQKAIEQYYPQYIKLFNTIELLY